MPNDLDIAQAANLKDISEIADMMGLGSDDLDLYGSSHVAKIVSIRLRGSNPNQMPNILM